MMLDFFVGTAQAQAAAPAAAGQQGSTMFTMMMFGSLILVWWLIVIRPQANAAKNHRKMVTELKRGDLVITHSGMFGKIAAVEESAFLIEVSKGMKIRFLKDKVARTYAAGSEEPSGS
jgi:preprotein translocase subunit YajC